jgi:hypothetical protein
MDESRSFEDSNRTPDAPSTPARTDGPAYRRRRQFSLRTLFPLIVLAGVAMSWFAARRPRSEHDPRGPVRTDFPVYVDVVYRVHQVDRTGQADFQYRAVADFTFRNVHHDEIRIHLPLLRAGFWFPGGTQFIDHRSLPAEWKQPHTATLKKGDSWTWTVNASGTCNHNVSALDKGFQYGRWALVFGVLDGEDPDQYLVGTVLSNPIHWQRAVPEKGN